MPMKSHFTLMARYNGWANSRLFGIAASLPDDLYRRDVGVYFKSLHGTLNHLLTTDRIWMTRLTGSGSHPRELNAIVFEDLSSLQAARKLEDQRIIDFVASLEDADCEKICDYRTLNGSIQRQPIQHVLAHLFNHQTHHRGQAHASLTRVGVAEPDPLDLLIMLRLESGE
jgi:uncharacterized damage-inducible protein DinB